MNKNNLRDKLIEIELPEVEIPSHRRNLRSALFARHSFGHTDVHSGYSKLKIMSFIKKAMPAGAIMAIVAVVALVSLNLAATTPVSAKELAQKSYDAVSGLTQDKMDQLIEATQENPLDILKEAIEADDLKIVSYDEFVNQEYQGSQIAITSNKSSMDNKGIGLKDLDYLQFTNSEGVLVSIGIDPETGLPGFVR